MTSITAQKKPKQFDRLTTLRNQLDQPPVKPAPIGGAIAPRPTPAAIAPSPVAAPAVVGPPSVPPAAAVPAKAQDPFAGVPPAGGNDDAARERARDAAIQKAKDATTERGMSDEDRFLADLMGDVNNVDTSEGEQLIQEQMDRLMGQGLMDSRARAGAAGMATSGGQLAAEGGIRSDAARDVSAAQLGVRGEARQNAIDNALSAIDARIGLSGAEDQSQLMDEFLNLLGEDQQPDAQPVDDNPMNLPENPQEALNMLGDAKAVAAEFLANWPAALVKYGTPAVLALQKAGLL